MFFPFIFLALIAGCEDDKGRPPPEIQSNLPHIRYFESSITGAFDVELTLIDYDLNTDSRTSIWQVDNSDVDRAEITPDGRFVLLHYTDGSKPYQYFVVYDIEGADPSTPIEFTKGEETSIKVSAYQSFLDDDVYRFGFVVGDPDFDAWQVDNDADVYQFAWVDLASQIIEDIPLVTSFTAVPAILYVPQGGGQFDILRKGYPDISRFDWQTADFEVKKLLYDENREPVHNVEYIGSFSDFSDFQKPSVNRNLAETAKVVIIKPDGEIELERGEFPVHVMGHKYAFIRIFSDEVIDKIKTGADNMDVVNVIGESEGGASFEILDLESDERMDIDVTIQNPFALPTPIFDIESDILALMDKQPEFAKAGMPAKPETTYTILVFSIPEKGSITKITGIPTATQTQIAFFRPKPVREL